MEQDKGPVIYESSTEDVFVLDLPVSIQHAQQSSRKLISCAPLQMPFNSFEPKSEKAKQRVQQREAVGQSKLNAIYADTIGAALAEVRRSEVSQYCMDRIVDEQAEAARVKGKKRKRENALEEASEAEIGAEPVSPSTPAVAHEDDVKHFLAHLAKGIDPRGRLWNMVQIITDMFSPTNHESFVNNSTDVSVLLSSAAIKSNHLTAATPAPNFRISPHSAALNSPLTSSINNLTALHTFLSNSQNHAYASAPAPSTNHTTVPSPKFPLLLLDPPWPNSSAKRSTSYSTYSFSGTSVHPNSLNSLIDNLLSLGLTDVLSEYAYVAIWITNRASVRAAALELLDAWGAVLVEEWIWAKVTEVGEPICELRGSGRRPWEVLLVARRVGGHENGVRDEVDGVRQKREEAKVTRRVIIAVPDLHSRKPCLKVLFERLLLGQGESAGPMTPVLELFARYMVAGWMSWGDEALKFQWEGCWREC